MANQVLPGTSQAPRGPQRSWQDLRDVPARAREEALRELGEHAHESLNPAFSDEEEDTAVIKVALESERAEIERLCREFTEEGT